MKTNTIILSIHPRHIEKILSGQKRYKYRKYIPTDIQHIVVYISAPIKAIVAFIDVDIERQSRYHMGEDAGLLRHLENIFHGLLPRKTIGICYPCQEGTQAFCT